MFTLNGEPGTFTPLLRTSTKYIPDSEALISMLYVPSSLYVNSPCTRLPEGALQTTFGWNSDVFSGGDVISSDFFLLVSASDWEGYENGSVNGKTCSVTIVFTDAVRRILCNKPLIYSSVSSVSTFVVSFTSPWPTSSAFFDEAFSSKSRSFVISSV